MYWEPDKECLDREELEQLQIERLQSTLTRVYAHVPFYRKKFDFVGVLPEDIESLSDLARLPFTTKDEVRGNYPYGMFAVPLREVVRIHATSGTTETAAVVGYTRNDIKTWSNLAARLLAAGGVTKDDVVQICFAYGLSTGGFGLHYGAERIGASVIPASIGNTARQIKIMKDFKTTALVSTPSYAMLVAESIREKGIPVTALSLRYGLFGAEPWSEEMRRQIQDTLGIVATDNYGLSEVLGPGVSGECLERKGLHINEDHFLAEVIDPETLRPVPAGQMGELVITTLTREAFPMIRFRTRDLTCILPEPCPCGRTGRRMSRVAGRTDDMLVIKGAHVFPSQIGALLQEIGGGELCYQIVIDRRGAMDEVTVLVEADGGAFTGQERRQAGLADAIRKKLAHELGVTVDVKVVEKEALSRVEGKVKPVVDHRKL
jgi:phenylacetate-CoA ligase